MQELRLLFASEDDPLLHEEWILGKAFTVQSIFAKILSPLPGLTFPSPRGSEYVEPVPRF